MRPDGVLVLNSPALRGENAVVMRLFIDYSLLSDRVFHGREKNSR
jgi:hypothetical protein